MEITGKAYKYGDDVSTDLIFPGRYTYRTLSEEEMGEHALEDLDADFSKTDVTGGIIVAGYNWGCGSAREQAVKSIKAKGIKAIIAKGIARIYYRNLINEGLLPIICPEAAEYIEKGDMVTIDTKQSIIKVGDKTFTFPEFPVFVMGIIECGGIIENVKKEIKENLG